MPVSTLSTSQPLPNDLSIAREALASMTDEQQACFRRLASYQFDAPGAPMPFSRRLAEREGWSAAYTTAVIEEYRRFVFLAVSMDHVATPSKAVDAAWHLHLEYTREYWDVFCAQVLRTPLHHSPGTGAPDEPILYGQLYAQTLDSYCRVFGAEPPASIWPKPQPVCAPGVAGEANARVAGGWGAIRRYGSKLSWAVVLAMTTITCAYAGDLNVFDYAGPRFLHFYVSLCACALLLIFGLQKLTYRLRPWGTNREEDIRHDPTPEEVAYLTGGPGRMAQIATLKLMHAGAINFVKGKGRGSHVEAVGAIGTGRFASEWEWLRGRKDSRATYHTFCKHLMTQQLAIANELSLRGWLWARRGMRVTQFANRMLALLVLGTGFTKIVVGLSRERPVGLLVMNMIAFGVMYLILTSRLVGLGRVGPTKGARAALDSMRNQPVYGDSEPDTLLWQASLLGVGALAGTLWATYTNELIVGLPIASTMGTIGAGNLRGDSSSSCSSASSCSSSSCSSSSCSSSSCGGCSSN